MLRITLNEEFFTDSRYPRLYNEIIVLKWGSCPEEIVLKRLGTRINIGTWVLEYLN